MSHLEDRVDALGERTFQLAGAVIFLGGIALRSVTFFMPWTGVHNAWGGAFYGNVARNFLRYDLAWTKLAPVVNSGIVDPAQFQFYYHHPALTMWLTSLSFLVFGIHEWSARLAPLIFSLLTMGLVVAFARAVSGKATALTALLFMAVIPADAYYATQVDPNGSMSIFFTFLAVEAYRRWLASERNRYYALCVASIVLGCMTGWFTYLVIPGIVVHGWQIYRPVLSRPMRTRLWLLPAAAIAVFALFILHRTLALSGRPEVYDALSDRLRKRTVDMEMNRAAIMRLYARQFVTLYGLPFVLLMAAWLAIFIRDLRAKRLTTADWCVAILLSYGLLYALAFPGHLTGHDFFVRTYGPGVALASATLLWKQPAIFRRLTLRLAVIALTGVIALSRMLFLYAGDDRNNGVALREFGEAVAAHSTPRDPVLLPIREDRVLQYYVDRPTTFGLDTPEKLDSARASIAGPYLILVPERASSRFTGLVAYLRERYPARRQNALLIFEATGAGRVR